MLPHDAYAPALFRCAAATLIMTPGPGRLPLAEQHTPTARLVARARRVQELVGTIGSDDVRWPEAAPAARGAEVVPAGDQDADPQDQGDAGVAAAADGAEAAADGDAAPTAAASTARTRRRRSTTVADDDPLRTETARRRGIVATIHLQAIANVKTWGFAGGGLTTEAARARIDHEAAARCTGADAGLLPLWRYHLADAFAEAEQDRHLLRTPASTPTTATAGASRPRTRRPRTKPAAAGGPATTAVESRPAKAAGSRRRSGRGARV